MSREHRALKATDLPAPDGFEPITVRVPDACRMLGIRRSKFYELIADGEIRILKLGSATLVPMEQIRALVRRLEKG
ncbi:helix-turn-helix domain-containing protein [Sphingobium sp. CR2-8]|uniref:helix-turn-helix domain-containing protein n=1 Tax=Sphingobium sp. CR2-8 TaxID=1306534 RepID=UPI002DBCB62C|nr:helix-turn-helix domain-containing protein [Sphingobium sp. CR2-8]MEC3910312.1 helix-turn-helix domain-containing protein [Sphingobium sp. CR2-8]